MLVSRKLESLVAAAGSGVRPVVIGVVILCC